MNIKMIKTAFAALALSVSGLASAGIIYVTDGDSNKLHAYDTTTQTMLWEKATSSSPRGAYPIAVSDNIWLGQYYGGNTAVQYDLNGNATGVTSNASTVGAVDGTSDGVMNYALRGAFGSSSSIVSANSDWTNQQTLFNINNADSRLVGITFDTVFKNLWVSSSREIMQYDLTGNLISSFSHSTGDGGALAYDQETDSLWLAARGSSSNKLIQFDKTGSTLQTQSVGFNSNYWGAEFAITATSSVPEPSTLAIFALGIMGLASRRFKKL